MQSDQGNVNDPLSTTGSIPTDQLFDRLHMLEADTSVLTSTIRERAILEAASGNPFAALIGLTQTERWQRHRETIDAVITQLEGAELERGQERDAISQDAQGNVSGRQYERGYGSGMGDVPRGG